MSFGYSDASWVDPDDYWMDEPYKGTCERCDYMIPCLCDCGNGYCTKCNEMVYGDSSCEDGYYEGWEADYYADLEAARCDGMYEYYRDY